jgi:hypothetical protein
MPVAAPKAPPAALSEPATADQPMAESPSAALPAPVEPAKPATPIAAPAAPAMAIGRVEPPVRPAPPAAPEPPAAPAAAADVTGGPAGTEAMNAYREEMRRRFDSYMKERQAQMEEIARRQREQREAAMANPRQAPPAQRPMPYPYPNMPAYGPRYPSAYPGYRTPYWQQP